MGRQSVKNKKAPSYVYDIDGTRHYAFGQSRFMYRGDFKTLDDLNIELKNSVGKLSDSYPVFISKRNDDDPSELPEEIKVFENEAKLLAYLNEQDETVELESLSDNKERFWIDHLGNHLPEPDTDPDGYIKCYATATTNRTDIYVYGDLYKAQVKTIREGLVYWYGKNGNVLRTVTVGHNSLMYKFKYAEYNSYLELLNNVTAQLYKLTADDEMIELEAYMESPSNYIAEHGSTIIARANTLSELASILWEKQSSLDFPISISRFNDREGRYRCTAYLQDHLFVSGAKAHMDDQPDDVELVELESFLSVSDEYVAAHDFEVIAHAPTVTELASILGNKLGFFDFPISILKLNDNNGLYHCISYLQDYMFADWAKARMEENELVELESYGNQTYWTPEIIREYGVIGFKRYDTYLLLPDGHTQLAVVDLTDLFSEAYPKEIVDDTINLREQFNRDNLTLVYIGNKIVINVGGEMTATRFEHLKRGILESASRIFSRTVCQLMTEDMATLIPLTPKASMNVVIDRFIAVLEEKLFDQADELVELESISTEDDTWI